MKLNLPYKIHYIYEQTLLISCNGMNYDLKGATANSSLDGKLFLK